MKLSKQKLYILILICGASGASIPSFAKIALESMSSGILTLTRYAITLLALLLFFGLRQKINWRNVRDALPVSVFIAINVIIFAVAIRYISASSSPLLYNTIPLMVAILSWRILKSHLGPSKIIGLLVGFLGVALVALAPYIDNSASLRFNSLGLILVFLGSLAFSFYTVLVKPIQDRTSPAEMLVAASIVTLVCQVGYMAIFSESFSVANTSSRSLFAAVEIASVGTLLFYGLYQYLIKVSGPVSASLMIYVQPATGAIWSLTLLGDRLSLVAILGGIISLIGIAQVNDLWSELKKKFKTF